MIECIPAHAPELLGFGTLRSRLESLALSEPGRERIRQLGFWTDLDRIRLWMSRTEALKALLACDDPPPIEPWPDVRTSLKAAAVVDAALSGAELVALARWLRQVRRLRSYLALRREQCAPLWEAFGSLIPLPELEEAILKALTEDGQVRPTASPELIRFHQEQARVDAQLRRRLEQILQQWAAKGFLAEDQPTFRAGRLVLPVRVEHKRHVAGFVHDVSATGQTVYVEPAAVLELNNELRALEAEIERERERVLRALTESVRAQLASLERNLELMASFDELWARAQLARELRAEMPELTADGSVALYEARHPVLWLSREDKSSVVPVTLEVGRRARVLVISGPNAGGKSVTMKTVGLLVLMAQAGLLIPAHPRSRIGIFERVGVDIGDAQSVESDLSTFSAHLARQRDILARADERTLVLIDELGTATDPEEGALLGQAVLEELLQKNARVIVTTHHGALKSWALVTEGAENGSMAFDEKQLKPTYRFQAGLPGRSYAFEIARRIGLPDAILDRAQARMRASSGKLESVLAAWEAERQAMAEARLRLEQEREALERMRSEWAAQKARWEAELAALRAKALEEAERVLAEARATVERTIREIREAQAERERTRNARAALERLHESIRRERHQLATSAKAAEPIAVGDWVELLDRAGLRGQVLEVSGDQVLLRVGEFRLRTHLDQVRRAVMAPKPEPVQVRSLARPMLALHARHELDIRGMRSAEAALAVERFLDEALAAGLQQVRVIHGKGHGVLRQVVQEVARSHPAVSGWAEARPEEGGAGVSILMLR